MKNFILLLVLLFLSFSCNPTFGVYENVDGLEFTLRKVTDVPLDSTVVKKFDLYELYFENKSNKTFSIPGYSIDFGVDYLTLDEIKVFMKDKNSKKIAVFNLATGAAAIAFGGIARTAANTALKTISFKKRNSYDNNAIYLSQSKTYVLYPNYSIPLYFFLEKNFENYINSIKFICRYENLGINYVVINNDFSVIDSASVYGQVVSECNGKKCEAKDVHSSGSFADSKSKTYK